ncbi:MAG: hypothetical protein IT580_16175 [Verrucomicrobiales bacterium]|nr:hypothetical protein [Verrucomicrobiales bacterium]
MSEDDAAGGRRKVREPSESGAMARAARVGPRLLLIKALLLLGLAVGGALLFRVPGVREFLAPAGRLTLALQELGPWAWPVFLIGSLVLIGVGVPRLLFCPLAGAVFGFWGGLGASTLATMGAYFATFLFLRGRMAERDVTASLPASLSFLRHDPGLAGVILTRLMPVPGLVGTVALSLSPVRKRAFLAGSLVGLVPEAVPLIMLGAGLFQGNPKQLAWLGAGGMILILGVVFLIRRLLARYRVAEGRRPGAE